MGLFAEGGGGKGGNEDDYVYKKSGTDNEGRYVFKSQGNSTGSNTFNSLGINLVNAIGVNVYNSTISNQVQSYSEEINRTAKVKVEERRDMNSFVDRLKTVLNPFEDTYRTFDIEVTGGVQQYTIDNEGYLDLNQNPPIFSEVNVGNVARLFGRARSVAQFVRSSRAIKNTSLKNFLTEYYRLSARIGNGSSAAALTYEAETGLLLSRTGHFKKVFDARTYFMNVLNGGKGSLTKFEKRFVTQQLIEIQKALHKALDAGSKYRGELPSINRGFQVGP
jgi:hypothetical protein